MRYEDVETLMIANGITKDGYKFWISDNLYFTDELDGDVSLISSDDDETVCTYKVEDLEQWCPTFKAFNICATCEGGGEYPSEFGHAIECDCYEKPINK